MPGKKRASIRNEKQYEALKEKGMSKERAAKISNASGASQRGGRKSHSTSSWKPRCQQSKLSLTYTQGMPDARCLLYTSPSPRD